MRSEPPPRQRFFHEGDQSRPRSKNNGIRYAQVYPPTSLFRGLHRRCRQCIAGIDGVSHEIEKWADILERNGYRCFYCAGEIDRPHEKSAVVEEAHFAHPDVTRITQSLFGTTVRSKYDTKQVFDIANLIREGIEAFIRRFDIDCSQYQSGG